MKEKNLFTRFDNYILELVNSRMKTRFFDYFFQRFTKLAGVSFISVVLLLIFILPTERKIKSFAIEAGVALIFTGMTVHTIKFLAKRVRPYDLLEGLNTFDIIMRDYSFPSGHTAAAFSLAIMVGAYYPGWFLFMMVFAVLIGISRMYLAVHFPTDVLVGAIVGMVITAFSKAVISPHILSIAIQTLNLWLYC